jgi:hypothetical protein
MTTKNRRKGFRRFFRARPERAKTYFMASFMPSDMPHIIMLPHIIIIGIPIFIMPFIMSQACIIMSLFMPPIGIMVQTILSPIISQVMAHIIIGIIMGIMPPNMGICIWGIMFIIGIAGIIIFSSWVPARSPRSVRAAICVGNFIAVRPIRLKPNP